MKRKLVFILALVLAVSAIGVGTVSAYFIANDTAINTVRIGNVDITLTEPSFDQEDAEEVVPNETLPKDPQVTNVGNLDAYIFLEVKNSYENIVTYDDRGYALPAADTEGVHYSPNAGWVLLSEMKNETDKTIDRVYAYGTAGELTILQPGEQTVPLFDTVTTAKFAELLNDKRTYTMKITAYAIQTLNLDDGSENTLNGNNADGKTDPVSVWSIVQNVR